MGFFFNRCMTRLRRRAIFAASHWRIRVHLLSIENLTWAPRTCPILATPARRVSRRDVIWLLITETSIMRLYLPYFPGPLSAFCNIKSVIGCRYFLTLLPEWLKTLYSVSFRLLDLAINFKVFLKFYGSSVQDACQTSRGITLLGCVNFTTGERYGDVLQRIETSGLRECMFCEYFPAVSFSNHLNLKFRISNNVQYWAHCHVTGQQFVHICLGLHTCGPYFLQ